MTEMETIIEAVETAIKAEERSIEYHEKQITYHTEYYTNAKQSAEQKKAQLIKELALLKDLVKVELPV